MTTAKYEKNYSQGKVKAKKRHGGYSSGTIGHNETIAPEIGKTEILKVLKRFIGLILILLAAVFGKTLSSLNVPALFIIVFSYICAQAYLWFDLFDGDDDTHSKK